MLYSTIDSQIYKLSCFHGANMLHISKNCTKDRFRTTPLEQSVIHLIYTIVSLHNTTKGKEENVSRVHNRCAENASGYISITSHFL